MEKLEVGLKPAFPCTEGHFSRLVALIIHNPLKCSYFQRLIRDLKWGSSDQQSWKNKKIKKKKRDKKRIQGNIKKGLRRTEVPNPRLTLHGCLLALEKTQFDRYLLFPLHNAQVPWAAPLYTSRTVSAQTEQRSWASISDSSCSALRDRALAQPGGRNHSVITHLVSKSKRCRHIPWWFLPSCKTKNEVESPKFIITLMLSFYLWAR